MVCAKGFKLHEQRQTPIRIINRAPVSQGIAETLKHCKPDVHLHLDYPISRVSTKWAQGDESILPKINCDTRPWLVRVQDSEFRT